MGELVWVKVNLIEKMIVSGRTGRCKLKKDQRSQSLVNHCLVLTSPSGHYMNHTKEHCVIGVKGDFEPQHFGLDCDVLVSEVGPVILPSSMEIFRVFAIACSTYSPIFFLFTASRCKSQAR